MCSNVDNTSHSHIFSRNAIGKVLTLLHVKTPGTFCFQVGIFQLYSCYVEIFTTDKFIFLLLYLTAGATALVQLSRISTLHIETMRYIPDRSVKVISAYSKCLLLVVNITRIYGGRCKLHDNDYPLH